MVISINYVTGEVGEVIELRPGGAGDTKPKVRVKFAKGSWKFKERELTAYVPTDADSAPPSQPPQATFVNPNPDPDPSPDPDLNPNPNSNPNNAMYSLNDHPPY